MKKLHPILFSPAMSQALLDNRKTMTRRVIKPQPIDNTEVDGNFFEGNHKGYVKVDGHPNWKVQFIHEFCKYKAGDVLWVREKYRKSIDIENGNTELIEYAADDPDPIYRCDGDGFQMFNSDGSEKMLPFKPSIHMPYDVCRIFLKITNIRIERLWEITDEDAVAEGILCHHDEHGRMRYKEYGADASGYGDPNVDYPTCGVPKFSFRTLWESINGSESWDQNPWAWVIEFEQCNKPQ